MGENLKPFLISLLVTLLMLVGNLTMNVATAKASQKIKLYLKTPANISPYYQSTFSSRLHEILPKKSVVYTLRE